MVNDRLQKAMARIRKVLAKAEGTDNTAEADMLMLKVQSMLDEHNLQLLDVERANDEDPIGTDHNAFHHFVKDSWFKWTVVRMAQLYGARVSWFKATKNKTLMSVSGRQSARITLELMLPFVRKQIRERGRAYAAKYQVSQAKAERMIANALNDRIARLAYEAREKDRERIQRGLNALVPVDLVEAEFDRAHGKTRSVSQGRTKTTHEAVAEANEISLHRQTGVEKARRLT